MLASSIHSGAATNWALAPQRFPSYNGRRSCVSLVWGHCLKVNYCTNYNEKEVEVLCELRNSSQKRSSFKHVVMTSKMAKVAPESSLNKSLASQLVKRISYSFLKVSFTNVLEFS